MTIGFSYYKDNVRTTENLVQVGNLEKTDANWFVALFNSCKERGKDWKALTNLLLSTHCPLGAQIAMKYQSLNIPMENLHFFSDYTLTKEDFEDVKAYCSIY